MEIVVRHLCKSFGDKAVLRDVTFTAGRGITAVMAPSGTGKTTLLRILLGLERADSGTVEGLAGKKLSAVFQEDRLLEHLSAEGNLRFVLGRAYDPDAARALLAPPGPAGHGRPDRAGVLRRHEAAAGPGPGAAGPPSTPCSWTSPSPGWTGRTGTGPWPRSGRPPGTAPSCW